MVIRKRQLLWDWTNTSGPGNPGVPQQMNNVPFGGSSPMASVNNWNVWVPPELKGRAPFRPMVRGLGQTSGNDWAVIQNTKYEIILFFNEPERAGITPEHARDIWYKQMLPLRHSKGKKLGSPAVASDAKGIQWLESFMRLTAKDPPDYLCLHYYSTNADAAIKYITEMHNKYRHPVMVTEIACIDRNYSNVLKFTIKVCNWMDQQSWIFEYGLFDFQRKVADGFVSPAAQLMAPDGHFTQLGYMYLHDQPMREPAKPHSLTAFEETSEHGVEDPTEQDLTIPPSDTPDEVNHAAPELNGNPTSTPDTDTNTSTPEDETAITGTPITAEGDTQPPEPTTADEVSEESDSSHGSTNSSTNSFALINEPQAQAQEHLTTAALSADQANALRIHNDGRRGKNLHPLSWDNNLANHAHAWAQNLARIGKLQHSTGAQRPNEGENLAWVYSSSSVKDPLAGAARMWMNEAKDYHGEKIGQGNFEKYGHYTQCMWHSTTRVGMASAKDAKGGVYTVGRYSPPGNWTGQKPY